MERVARRKNTTYRVNYYFATVDAVMTDIELRGLGPVRSRQRTSVSWFPDWWASAWVIPKSSGGNREVWVWPVEAEVRESGRGQPAEYSTLRIGPLRQWRLLQKRCTAAPNTSEIACHDCWSLAAFFQAWADADGHPIHHGREATGGTHHATDAQGHRSFHRVCDRQIRYDFCAQI